MNLTNLKLLFLSVLLCPLLLAAQSKVKTSAVPGWVDAFEYEQATTTQSRELSGGMVYLLYDQQAHLEKEVRYSRIAYKFLDSQGMQDNSTISVDFDPSYQKLTFHRLGVYRNGQWIDKLEVRGFQLLRRETRMERYIYDGTETALMSLDDIRKGDVLEYSYSIEGFNPLYEGKFSTDFFGEAGFPIQHLHLRFVANASRDLQYRSFKGTDFGQDWQPVITRSGGKQYYVWERKEVPAAMTEDNIPASYDYFEHCMMVDWEDWGAVNDWARKYYRYRDQDLREVKEEVDRLTKDLEEPNKKATALIRFVQREIRYLGLEGGIGAYKPRSPDQVLSQRYGDCKDKSLLLCAMLDQVGIEAVPLLVSTYDGPRLQDRLPTPHAFDHCVVMVQPDEDPIVVDPTFSHQGGGLQTLYARDYHQGLPLKAGINELVELPDQTQGKTHIFTDFTIDDKGSPVTMTIRTERTGGNADLFRMQMAGVSQELIQESYLDFYGKYYAEVEPLEDIEILDDDTLLGSNLIIVKEKYKISDFWTPIPEDSLTLEAEFFPMELINALQTYQSKGRTQPYALMYPYDYYQTLEIYTGEKWDLDPVNSKVKGPGFRFSMKGKRNFNVYTLEYEYHTTTDQVPADSTDLFFEKQEEIADNCTYLVTTRQEGGSGSGGFLLTLLVTLLILGGGTWGMVQLIRKYNPPPRATLFPGLPIGGWLVAALIVMILLLLRETVSAFTNALWWNGDLWSQYLNPKSTWYDLPFSLYFLYETTATYLYIVFGVGVLWLFFKRRTSVPRLTMLFFAIQLLFAVTNYLAAHHFVSQGYEWSGYGLGSFVFPVIVCGIFIPLFQRSDLVKETFVKGNQAGGRDPRE